MSAASWEDIANEVVPSEDRPGGLATGARRGGSRPNPQRHHNAPGTLAPPASPQIIPCPPFQRNASLDEALGGLERLDASHGPYYFIEKNSLTYSSKFATLRDDLERTLKQERFPELSGADIDDLLFMDIETGGLSSDSPLFLIGTMRFDGSAEPQLEFFLARSYEEEKAVLAAYHQRARGKILITFNGRSFDWPYISGRSVRHSLRFPRPKAHLDLLQTARRTWRHQVPNCRLQTLETYLCGRVRVDDVPSSQIPRTYDRFLELHEAHGLGSHLMAPILHHNALDVLTMAELLCLAAEGGGR